VLAEPFAEGDAELDFSLGQRLRRFAGIVVSVGIAVGIGGIGADRAALSRARVHALESLTDIGTWTEIEAEAEAGGPATATPWCSRCGRNRRAASRSR